MPIKVLSGMLLSVVLAAPMVVEAGRGHHHHHGHHRHRHHYKPPNIYYNPSYYPPAPVYYPPAPAYGVAPGYLFMGINTGNASFMLGY